MELRHLRYFVMVAEELNISRASARLRVTQPAVSRQLRDLESELGVKLFVREKHGLKLSSAGAVFLAHARDLIQRSGEALRQMEAFASPANDSINIGYITPVLSTILTPTLRRFSEDYPDVEIGLYEMTPGQQVSALRDGRIDLAMLGNPCGELHGEFNLINLRRLPLQSVLPDNHCLALRKRVALAELAEETFVGFLEEAFPGRNAAIIAGCQAAGFTPRLRHRAESLSAMLALVAAGKGVSLAPSEVSQIAHPQVVFIPVTSPTPYVNSSAATRRDDRNPMIRAFVDSCGRRERPGKAKANMTMSGAINRQPK